MTTSRIRSNTTCATSIRRRSIRRRASPSPRACARFLRQDPNIIMVGEIRDAETADIAVQAALTGHLLLSSLHTNDAPTAVPRFFDLNIPPFLVCSVLNLVLAQRLVRKICPSCIYSTEIDDARRGRRSRLSSKR